MPDREFFAPVIPKFMMAEGIQQMGSGNTLIIEGIGPIFTIIFSTLILPECIAWLQIVGTLLVLGGVFFIGWKGWTSRAVPATVN